MGILAEKSIDYAVRIVRFAKFLQEKHEYILANQILKSGTSIGANITESVHGESRSDLIHKLAIAQKECSETLYWLTVMNRGGIINETEFTSLHSDGDEILKMITSSILTLKNGPRQ